MSLCQYCQKECVNENSHRNHERLCPKNAKRVYVNGMRGKSAWNKGKTKKTHPELSEKLSAGGKGLAKSLKRNGKKPVCATAEYWTPERRKEKSEWRKKLHKENPESHPNRKLANNRNTMSYPERVAFDFLTNSGVQFEHNKNIDKYWVDFCVGSTIVEIDGARWHNKDNDKRRDLVLNSLGYIVYRIDTKEQIEQRLKDILG